MCNLSQLCISVFTPSYFVFLHCFCLKTYFLILKLKKLKMNFLSKFSWVQIFCCVNLWVCLFLNSIKWFSWFLNTWLQVSSQFQTHAELQLGKGSFLRVCFLLMTMFTCTIQFHCYSKYDNVWNLIRVV